MHRSHFPLFSLFNRSDSVGFRKLRVPGKREGLHRHCRYHCQRRRSCRVSGRCADDRRRGCEAIGETREWGCREADVESGIAPPSPSAQVSSPPSSLRAEGDSGRERKPARIQDNSGDAGDAPGHGATATTGASKARLRRWFSLTREGWSTCRHMLFVIIVKHYHLYTLSKIRNHYTYIKMNIFI